MGKTKTMFLSKLVGERIKRIMAPISNNYAEAEMLIRKPLAEVFEAFIDPSITTKFWFTKAVEGLK